jgi:hypothetical protein
LKKSDLKSIFGEFLKKVVKNVAAPLREKMNFNQKGALQRSKLKNSFIFVFAVAKNPPVQKISQFDPPVQKISHNL